MKTKYFYVFFLCLNSLLFSQQLNWLWKNPIPQGNRLNCVRAIDNNTIIAAGECGVIIRSVDGGANWNIFQYEDTTQFVSISFINTQTGWIAGGVYALPVSVNIVLKTTDSGLNWVRQETSFSGNNITSVYFTDANSGFAAGGTFNEGRIIKTTNGGSNWTLLPINFNFQIESLFFLNPATGWAGSRSSIHKTTNGGLNWTSIAVTGLINSIYFIDSINGFATRTSGNAYRTSNGGLNWTSFNISGTSLSFSDEHTGWMTGHINPSRVYKTTNAGFNWTAYNYQTLEYILSLDFVDIQTGFGVGAYGVLQKSTSGGVNWVNLLKGAQTKSVEDISFPSLNTGYYGGGYGYEGEIAKTTDGGESWHFRFALPILVKSVEFVNEDTGWACGLGYTSNQTGMIWKTTDGGNSWIQQHQMLVEDYTDLKFINSNTGFAFGHHTTALYGIIKKTTDGGLSWQNSGLGGQSVIYEASLVDINTIFVACMSGRIYLSTDSGASWNSINTGTTSDVTAIQFEDINTGWFGNNDGQIYKTTNSGASWVNQFRTQFRITDFEFLNNELGWASSGGGALLYTTNGGFAWNQYNRFTYNIINAVLFQNSNTGFVAGGTQMVLKTTNGGGIIGINSISSQTPKIYGLSQNYPNPFNPITNIKFDIPKTGFVKIVVYDLLGMEVTNLVNEQMQPGSYNVDWDASNFPSGVYFYKLESGDFVESKKMVLVK